MGTLGLSNGSRQGADGKTYPLPGTIAPDLSAEPSAIDHLRADLT
jgi:hypothetical protein